MNGSSEADVQERTATHSEGAIHPAQLEAVWLFSPDFLLSPS